MDKYKELTVTVPDNSGRCPVTLMCICLRHSHTSLDKIKNKLKVLEMKVEMSSPGLQ